MTTLREAATHALEALEGGADSWQLVGPAIDALKEALVEDAMQKFTDVNQEIEAALAEPVEPVAWTYEWKHRLHGGSLNVSRARWPESHLWIETPLYAAPPQRKPLTREEAIALWADKSDGPSNSEIVSFARAIERAHGII